MATVPEATDAPAATADFEATSPSRARGKSRALFALVVALVMLPLLVTWLSVAGARWHPVSDIALEMLRIGDVGGRHTPLVGPQSRFGWDHPGPLLFWMLTPFRMLAGDRGVLVGVGLINAAAIIGALIVARRRGGMSLVVCVGVLTLVLIHAFGPSLLVDPWNPWVPVLPFLVFVLLAWSVAERDFATMPWLVGVGSLLVQTHVGYAPLVIGLGVFAILLAVPAALPRATDGEKLGRGDAGRWTMIAVGVGALLWLPPLVQQFTGSPGNLGEIVRYFRHPTEPAAGARIGFGVMGTELGTRFPWVTGHDVSALGVVATSSTIAACVLLVVTGVLAVVAGRRATTNTVSFGLLAVAAAALGVLAGSRITGILGTYLVRWWWVVAATIWLSLCWSAWSLLRRTPAARAIATITLAALAVLSVVTAGDALRAEVPQKSFSVAVARLAPKVARELPRDQTYLVNWVDSRDLGAAGVGMFLELSDRGYRVKVTPLYAHAFGRWRSASPKEVDGTVTVVGIADEDDGWLAPAGALLLARYDPLTRAERRRVLRLTHEVRSHMPSDARSRSLPAETRYVRSRLIRRGMSASAVDEWYKLRRRVGYSVYFIPSR